MHLLRYFYAETLDQTDLIVICMMKKLTIKTHPCLRPDIFQEKAFAPTVMGQYDVRRETFFLKSHRIVITSLSSNNFCLKINNSRMCVFGTAAIDHEGMTLTPFHIVGF